MKFRHVSHISYSDLPVSKVPGWKKEARHQVAQGLAALMVAVPNATRAQQVAFCGTLWGQVVPSVPIGAAWIEETIESAKLIAEGLQR